jgi:DNA-binding transcriptional MerR regulator
MSAAPSHEPVPNPEEWSVDQLAAHAGLPVRTIREYQTLGIVPAPRRVGRVGLYGTAHLRRLELIGQLKDRGYSLAGIGDLLGNWRAGADLGEVLGLEPDQLVHIDEPGAPSTLNDLAHLLPGLVPEHLDALTAAGVIEPAVDGSVCVPSPSALQLARDALAAGIAPDQVVALLDVLGAAADQIAAQVVDQLTDLPPSAATDPLLARGRGLLAHSIGRLTLHRVGRRLLAGDRDDLTTALARAGVPDQ